MTREEAIAFFKDMNECTYGNLEAVEMAIKALEQEPSEDAISRQAYIERFRKWAYSEYGRKIDNEALAIRVAMSLPSVKPQEPKWIPVSERLPEESGEYLIAIKDRTYLEISWFYPSNKEWSYRNLEIVAWMPLPKPYEPQESEDKGCR